jgi:hypothetical protein
MGIGGPPSPEDIANKPSQSTMSDGHFKVAAVVIDGANHTNGSGDGVFVLKGKTGFKLNFQISAGLLNVGVDLYEVGGKQYKRIGTGPWTITPDTASPASRGAPSYVGESQIGSDKAWHIRFKETGTTYDEWVRESDGYLVKYAWQFDAGSFTIDFDQFNIGAEVTAPSLKEVAASQYLALVTPINTQSDSIFKAIQADGSNLSALKADMQRDVDLEQQFIDGLATIDFPADSYGDVQDLVTAERSLLALEQREAKAASWAQVNAIDPALTKAGSAAHAAAVKLRADIGLPPP